MSEHNIHPNPDTEAQNDNYIIEARKEKLKKLSTAGINPYPYKYTPTINADEIHARYSYLAVGEHNTDEISIAGRLISWREHGKTIFGNIRDGSGNVQIYIKLELIGEEVFKEFLPLLDIGDIVGVKGSVFRTKKGEITVQIEKIELLSKSINPLPDKWHGLKDIELRYRQRYVDLIANQDVKNVFVTRSRVVSFIRKYLEERAFLEVETPMLQAIMGGANARPFKTHHNALDMELYLRIAPELYLKRLLVGGFDRVFEINRNFRNEGVSTKHNPEFTMMELYQAYADYSDMMDITKDMLQKLSLDIYNTLDIEYGEHRIDMSDSQWHRKPFYKSIEDECGIDFSALSEKETHEAATTRLNLKLSPKANKAEVLDEVFGTFVEHKLINPTFITDYPIELSPLAKKHRSNPELTERFELFIMGREIGNAYSELNDPIDQRERFLEQVKAREGGNEEAAMMDDDYINALSYGMPPAGGLGIGIDRLVMIFTNSQSIRDVILFPHMRSNL